MRVRCSAFASRLGAVLRTIRQRLPPPLGAHARVRMPCLASPPGRCSATTTKRGEVLIIGDGVGKSHDGEKILFEGLTFSVV